MIVLDANILLYAYDTESPLHHKSKAWLERTLSGGGLVGMPWQTIGAFLRIATNTKLSGDRFSSSEACDIVESWLAVPNLVLLQPTDHFWKLLRETIITGQAQGPLITDAQLAAITINYGATLATTDRDFARFPGLLWLNPLAP